MKKFTSVLLFFIFFIYAGCSGDKYKEIKDCFADMKDSQTEFMNRITSCESGQQVADAIKDNLNRSVKQIQKMKELDEKFPELRLLADEPAEEWVRDEYDSLQKHAEKMGTKAASVMLKYIDDPAVTEIFQKMSQFGTEEQK